MPAPQLHLTITSDVYVYGLRTGLFTYHCTPSPYPVCPPPGRCLHSRCPLQGQNLVIGLSRCTLKLAYESSRPLSLMLLSVIP